MGKSSEAMAWAILFIASLCEIAWSVGMKYADGFSKFWPSAITILFMIFSAVLLSMAMKELPLGTAYTVWTGVGAAGAAILGIALFGEATTPARLISIGLIIAGVIGLKLSS